MENDPMMEAQALYMDPEDTPADPRRTTLIITCAALVLVSCCCIVGAGLVAWLDPFDWNLIARLTGNYDAAAEAVPASADIYVGIDLLQLQSADAERIFRAFAESSPDSPFASSEDLLDSLDEEFADEGISFTEDVLSWVGQYVGIGVTGWQFTGTGDVESADFIFAASIRDRAGAEAFSLILQEQIVETNGEVLKTTEYEGTTIFFAQGAADDGAAFAIHGGLFLVSTTPANIQAAIDAKSGTSFMDTEVFRDLVDDLPGDEALTFFFQSSLLEEFSETVNSGLVSGLGTGPGFLWQAGAVSLSFVPEGIRMDTILTYDRESVGAVQQQLLDSYAAEVAIDARVPQNTLLFLAGRRLDLSYALLREQFRNADQELDFDEAMASFESEFGFHPETDLLAHLDGEYAIAIVPTSDGFLASNDIDIGLELLFETSSPDGLAAFNAFLAEFARRELGVTPDPIDFNGQVIYQLADPFAGEFVSYTTTDDLFMLATSAGLIGDVLTGGSSLRDNPDYQASWESFPAGMRPVLYLDADNLLGTIREGLPEGARADFDAEVGTLIGPISKILLGNRFVGADRQLGTLLIFITGGQG